MSKLKKLPSILTKDEFEQVLKAVIKEHPLTNDPEFVVYCKMKTILQLLFIRLMGLRPNEARLIEIRHIDFINKKIFIPAKNNKTRQADFVPIPSKLHEPLHTFLKLRCKFFVKNQYLFACRGKHGYPDKNYLSAKFRGILKKCNISKENFKDKAGRKFMDKNLYSLRHSFGTEVYKKTNCNIQKTAVALRHYSVNMQSTMVYVHIDSNAKRKDVFDEVFEVKKPTEEPKDNY